MAGNISHSGIHLRSYRRHDLHHGNKMSTDYFVWFAKELSTLNGVLSIGILMLMVMIVFVRGRYGRTKERKT